MSAFPVGRSPARATARAARAVPRGLLPRAMASRRRRDGDEGIGGDARTPRRGLSARLKPGPRGG